MNLKRSEFKIFTILLLSILFFNIVSSQGCGAGGFMGTFEQNSNITITETCPTCTFINITVKDPDSEVVFTNQPMVLSNSIFSFGANSTISSKIGTYFVEGHSNLDDPFKSCYDISNVTISTTTSEAITYLIMILVASGLFLLSLYASIVIPFKNERDELGRRVIKITLLKYFKMGFMFLTYLLLVWVVNLTHVLSSNVVALAPYSTFFASIFRVLLSMGLPIFVIFVIFMIGFGWKDLALFKNLRRGINPR